MSKLCNLTVSETLEGLCKKDFSSLEVTQDLLDRIDDFNNLNLITEKIHDNAIMQAKASDNKRIKEETRPLEGLPVAVKDIFCTKNIKTTACSKMLSNFIPTYESTVTENLWKNGAILLCKTSMDEFAMGSASDTSYYGSVINPWTNNFDKPLTPGGSSGGSAGIVALRAAAVALGTDTGGSIRQPASFCGVVGLKPTYGSCSRFGIVAFSSSLDQAGPITRTVEDSAIIFEHMASYDIRDSTSFKRKPFKKNNITDGVKGLKVGIPKEYNIKELPNEVKKIWDKGTKWLRENGAIIEEISLPHTSYALATYYIIAPAEASANLARYDGVKYGYRADGPFDNLDEMYSKTRQEGFGDEVKRRILMGTYVLSSGYYDAYYLKAQKVRRKIVDDFTDAFKKVDAILTPTAPSTAFALGEKKDDPISMYLNDIFTVPASLAGLPAISVPAGIGGDGYPLGLQVISSSFNEEVLFKVAQCIEESASFKEKPKILEGK